MPQCTSHINTGEPVDVALADATRTTGSIRSNEAQRGACLYGCVDGLFPLVPIFLEECL